VDDRPRYRHWFRCRACAARFSVDRLTPDPERVKTPRCPRKSCGGKAKASFQADIPMDVAGGKAPGVIGAPSVIAYDMAMDAAAHNAGLTNLVDKPRYGESSVPKLRPDLQHKVDNFFGPANGAPKQKMLTKRADLSGIFGQRATDAQKSSPIPGMGNAAAMPGVNVASIVNRPGAAPPVDTMASWPPAGS
jgi:hypothetical protein